MRSCNSTRGSVGRSVRHTRVEFLNKAVYTTAPVAGSWAGAVMIWAGAYSNNKLSNPLNAQKCKKSKVWRTNRRTDGPTDTVTYRSRARDKKWADRQNAFVLTFFFVAKSISRGSLLNSLESRSSSLDLICILSHRPSQREFWRKLSMNNKFLIKPLMRNSNLCILKNV